MNSPPVRFHSTTLFVTDMERSRLFYTGILGQTIELDFGTNVILSCGITLWKMNSDHVILKNMNPATVTEPHGNRFELYFETPHVEAIFDKLRTSGTDMLHGVHEESWGQKTIRFFDPDRHLIEIGEPLETFIGRLSSEGMTPTEITVKTGVPLKKVTELIG